MIRRGRRRALDPSMHGKYERVGGALLQSATDLAELAGEGDWYGNAIGLIAIHGCIAYADALCIRFGGFKSTEGDHLRGSDALTEALGDRLSASKRRLFQRIVSQKDQVSYQGDYYTVEDARVLLADVRMFAGWAEELLI